MNLGLLIATIGGAIIFMVTVPWAVGALFYTTFKWYVGGVHSRDKDEYEMNLMGMSWLMLSTLILIVGFALGDMAYNFLTGGG